MIPPTRVLFVIPGSGHGSSMIFARRQADSLARVGVEVSLFYLGSRRSLPLVLAEFRRLRREMGRRRPDVIHAHFGTVTGFFTALASGRVPLIITYRGGDLNAPPASCRWQEKVRAACGHLLSQVAALKAREIICVSRPLRDRLWWKRKAVTILASGVDPEVFYPTSRGLARGRLGWSPTERVVLFNAGWDARVKRLDLAREAVEIARRRVPGLRLEILDGNVAPEMLPEMMNSADCLLLTSFSEGSPTVVQEALACNLPIVSVQTGDVEERLRGVRESTVASADASVLGRALANLVEPPRRSNGSEKIAGVSSGRIALRLKEMYSELAGG